MVERSHSAAPLIFVALITLGVLGAVGYALAEPYMTAALLNTVTLICAVGPSLAVVVLAWFAGQAWRDSRAHARRREDEEARQAVIYRRQGETQQQATDLAVLRQVVSVVEQGARAQLTAAKAQNEMARFPSHQLEDGTGWEIPATWADIE